MMYKKNALTFEKKPVYFGQFGKRDRIAFNDGTLAVQRLKISFVYN